MYLKLETDASQASVVITCICVCVEVTAPLAVGGIEGEERNKKHEHENACETKEKYSH